MALRTWTGGGGDNKASTSGNWDTGTPIAGDSVLFDDSASGTCDWDVTATLVAVSSGSFGSIAVTQTSKLTLTGNYNFGNGGFGSNSWDTNGFDIECNAYQENSGGITWNASSTLILVGTGNNIIDAFSNLTNVLVQKTSGTSSYGTASFNITGTLTLDCTNGNQSFNPPVGAGRTINKIVTVGISPNKTTVGGVGSFQFAVTDATGVNEYSDWQNVTVTGGPISCDSATCVDNGGNSGINFIVTGIVWDSGGVDSLWSTKENWVGDIAPTAADAVIFNGTSVANSTCDIAEVASVTIDAAYTGTITQSTDFTCLGNFDQSGCSWIASGFMFLVYGIRTGITPAIFIQDNSAGSSMYIGQGYNYTSAQTGNQMDSDDIILGYGNSGITFDSRNDDFRTRMNVKFNPGNIFRMIGRWYIDVCKAAGGTYTVTDNGSQEQWTDCSFLAMNEISFQPTAVNRIRLTLDGLQFNGNINLNGCQLDTGVGFDLPAGAKYINGGTMNHWVSGTAIGTINGYLGLETLNVGSAALTTRGGDLTVLGSVVVNDLTTVYTDDTIVVNKLDISNADLFQTGSLLVEDQGEFDANGTLEYFLITAGDETYEASAIVDLGTIDRGYTGAVTQNVTSNANYGGNIFINKTGGDMVFVDAIGGSGDLYRNAFNHTYNIQFLAGSTNTFNDTHADGSGSFVGNMISSVAATKFNMPLTVALTTDFHAGWKDSNVTGAIKNVDTSTGADNGNNTVAGLEGLNFADFSSLLIGGVQPTLNEPHVRDHVIPSFEG